MTPILIPSTSLRGQLMDRGEFDCFHAWDLGEGYSLEYWRGVDNNGAVLRTLRNGSPISFTHYATPGAAIRVLLIGSYPVPGLPPLSQEEREAAIAANTWQLRAGLVTAS